MKTYRYQLCYEFAEEDAFHIEFARFDDNELFARHQLAYEMWEGGHASADEAIAALESDGSWERAESAVEE